MNRLKLTVLWSTNNEMIKQLEKNRTDTFEHKICNFTVLATFLVWSCFPSFKPVGPREIWQQKNIQSIIERIISYVEMVPTC